MGDTIKFTISRRYCNCTVSVNGNNLGVIWESRKFETEEFFPTVRLGFDGQCVSIGDSGSFKKLNKETVSPDRYNRDLQGFSTGDTVDKGEYDWLKSENHRLKKEMKELKQ